MSWVRFTDDHGSPWEINQFGLWLLVRQYLHAQLMMENSATETERHWFSPDIVSVNVDFRAVREGKDDQAPRMYDHLAHVSMGSGETAMQQIIDMRRNTDFHTTEFRERQRAASSRTMGNIERAVSFGESAIQVAQVVRNISATVLVVGATFLSGGTALAVLGAGSSLKGVSTYQDTGNIGAAAIDASATFVVGAIPISAASATASMTTAVSGRAASRAVSLTSAPAATVALSARDRGAVLVVGATMNAGFEMSKGLVEGRTMNESVRRAGATFAVDVVSGGMLGPVLSRTCLPVGTQLAVGSVASVIGTQVVNAAGVQAEVSSAPEQLRNLMDATSNGDDNEQFVRENVFRPV